MKNYAEVMNVVLSVLIANAGLISEDEAAELVGVSPRRFRVIFRSVFGESFRVMRVRIRMEAARKQLVETNRSIADICEVLGYSKRDKMERLFKEHFGVTPAQYRHTQKIIQNDRSGGRHK